MDQLIPIINKLQVVFSTVGNEDIQLPQIVVIGSQSSGKSSVLEGIVGRDFLPRGSGIVTRRPLILQLHKTAQRVHLNGLSNDSNDSKDSQEISETESAANDIEEYAEFEGNEKRFIDFGLVRQEIERLTEEVAGSKKGISSKPIILKVYSPNVLNLTLVDLPGITKIPVFDQPEDIENQIRGMCFKYTENPAAVILAITPGNTDMATSEAIKLAREVDPEGHRTLAVVTKLDLMDRGTDAHDVLRGLIVNVRLGIIGVINRSQEDLNKRKTVAAALQFEKEFLQRQYPTIAHENGMTYLKQKLGRLLLQHIREYLPSLKTRIIAATALYTKRLSSLGESVVDPVQSVLQALNDFAITYRNTIDGTTPDIDMRELRGGARISHIFHEIYESALSEIDPMQALTDMSIMTAIRNTTGARAGLLIPEVTFEALVKQQISRLKDPSLRCVDLVNEELQRILQQNEQFDISRFPQLNREIVNVASALIFQRQEIANTMVSSLIDMELAYINTRHPDFLDTHKALIDFNKDGMAGGDMDTVSLRDDRNKESKHPRNPLVDDIFEARMSRRDRKSCALIKHLMVNYFAIVRKSLADKVPKAIMHYLVNYVKERLHQDLVTRIYQTGDAGLERAKVLLSESEHIVNRRRDYEMRLKLLKHADVILSEVRELPYH